MNHKRTTRLEVAAFSYLFPPRKMENAEFKRTNRRAARRVPRGAPRAAAQAVRLKFDIINRIPLSRGAPKLPLPLMSNHAKKFTIGIDIGGTKILVALLDDRFNVVAEAKDKTRPEKGNGYFLDTLADAVASVLKDGRAGRGEVIGIGAGCPGFIHPASGTIVSSPNIPFLKNFPLVKKLSRRTGFPATVGNDVQTGLYGEHQFGAARGCSNVIGIFMGTGIGGALILNGRSYPGAGGSAGEVGHILVDPAGPACGCGRRGCLEAFAGRLAISGEAAALVARGLAPRLEEKAGSDVRHIKSGALARAVEAGDRPIEELIRRKARRVGVQM